MENPSGQAICQGNRISEPTENTEFDEPISRQIRLKSVAEEQ